jgi:hypothetical protein
MAELVPELWLADASGHAILVHYPRTSCGFTQPAVRAALDLLTVEDTRTEKVHLVESRVAQNAGCPSIASPLMLAGSSLPDGVVAHQGVRANPGIAATPVPELTQPPGLTQHPGDVDSLRVCRYERNHSTSIGAAQLPGTFVGLGELRDDQVRAVLAAARAGDTSVDPCDAQADRFAMLLPIRDGMVVGPAVTVELDGCRRIAWQGMQAHAATEEILRLVS